MLVKTCVKFKPFVSSYYFSYDLTCSVSLISFHLQSSKNDSWESLRIWKWTFFSWKVQVSREELIIIVKLLSHDLLFSINFSPSNVVMLVLLVFLRLYFCVPSFLVWYWALPLPFCRYNIRYGKVTALDEDVDEAANAADIHQKVLTLKDGI